MLISSGKEIDAEVANFADAVTGRVRELLRDDLHPDPAEVRAFVLSVEARIEHASR